MSNEDPLLRVEEVAKRLRVSTKTIYRRLRTNRIKGTRPDGIWFIRASAVEAYLASKTATATPAAPDPGRLAVDNYRSRRRPTTSRRRAA